MIVTILAVILSLLLGYGLGSVPGLNEHLHWNLWFVVPISGLLFGAFIGCIQFGLCYRLNQKVAGICLAVLVVGALIGYVGIDYGIYHSISVPLSDVEGVPDGVYKLSDLMSFVQYMKYNLGYSSVTTSSGIEMYEKGAVGTTISYIFDLLGAMLGAVAMMFAFSCKYPYCDNCCKYKKRENKFEVYLEYEESLVEEIFSKLNELIEGSLYNDIVSYLQELMGSANKPDGNFKITADQRYCPDCLEASIVGNVYKCNKKEWNEIDELKFTFTSKPGEHNHVE